MITYETIGKLIDRLTTDAHNETGSVREYARSLLADLGLPMPADPETPRYTQCGYTGSFTVRHAYELADHAELARLANDCWEFCGKPASDPIHAPTGLEWSPRYPQGTPEYAEYEAKLKIELGKWVRGEGEYRREQS